ncbi:murein DD-endopeptidase MepM/ murein hydrolase activator NlpD [Paraburkholderia sp. GAS448]|uniref:LysM peptidoglycan-binding domain-containing protein n=1 Tax=Paraburkholderia sp. GAS448 TaxID=3035136 RepID=UPI003D1A97B8
MSDDLSEYYTVREHDTLSGIARSKGVAWQDIARENGISDPRTLRPGQRLRIPRNAGKVHAHVLDVAHNPLSGVSYRIQSAGRTVSGKTSSSGQTDDFWPTAAGQKVEFFIKKLSGEWKKVYETTSHEIDKMVTLVSPRLKLAAETHPHPENIQASQLSPRPRPKAEATGQQTPSKFAPGKGIKTEQATEKDGTAIMKVTSDDASLDEFLEKYTGDPITEDDYKDAAKELGCKVNAVKAVHETEVGAGSFTIVDGRTVPKILYERHYFYRLSGKKYWDTNPDLSYPVGYYRMGTKYLKKTQKLTKTDGTSEDVDVWVRFDKKKDKDQATDAEKGKQLLDEGVLTKERDTYGSFSYRRLRKAFRLNETAALESCSWGAFQIMGANYKTLGYSTVQEMVRDLSRSERPHLKGFVNFVKADPALLKAIQKEDFTTFASHYNGPSYAENNYDGTMKRHFDDLEKATATKSGKEAK